VGVTVISPNTIDVVVGSGQPAAPAPSGSFIP
jgi:hypothetical protein